MVSNEETREKREARFMCAFRYALFPLLFSLFILTFAQTIPEPPANPIGFLLRVLEREAVTNLRGEVREVQTFPPRQVAEQIRADLLAPPPILPAFIRKNFRVSAEYGEPIAGRETWRIRFLPKNTNAASFTIWVDQKWLLRLGIEERDSSGEVVYSAQFSSVSTPKPRNQARQLTLLETKPRLQAFVEKQTGLQLPDDFEVVDIRSRTVGKDNLPALEVRASNGISVLVLVFAPIGTANTPRIVSRKLGGAYVWLIGNLSRSELERSASSINASLSLDLLLSGFQNLR